MTEETGRLASVDVLRGIAIALMLIVNNQGDWSNVYYAVRHASWHGFGGADIVFPLFLFTIGASIHLSFVKRLEAGVAKNGLLLKVLRRSLILMLLGISLNLVNLFPEFNFSVLRIPGVLQRISLCYLLASMIYLYAGENRTYAIAALLLVAYWLLLMFFRTGDVNPDPLSPEGNICRYVDGRVFGSHTYGHAIVKGFDPEGLMSTIPAVASTLAGVFSLQWLTGETGGSKRLRGLSVAGALLIILGLAANIWMPINKNLWTPSYVLFASGISLCLLAACYWLADVRGYKSALKPFLFLGTNAIVLYCLSSVFGKFTAGVKCIQGEGRMISIKELIYATCFSSWLSGYNASLLYSIAFLALWTLIMYVLWKRNIFVKI